MKPVYINGSGAVSTQKNWDWESFAAFQPVDHSGIILHSVEPEYSNYIDTKYLRRMSRILKMGTAAAMMALREAAIAKPDGIITGTGYGCLDDTGTFINKMIDLNEQTLNPTPFIQSTHNSIGSQVALMIQCYGYNQTYTQEGISFENALLDAQLALNENPDQCLLTGAADEITDASHEIMTRFGIYRKTSASSLELLNTKDKGTLHGEGAFYFALSGNRGEHCKTVITAVVISFGFGENKFAVTVTSFLKNNGLTSDDVDLVLLGDSGDINYDDFQSGFVRGAFGNAPIGHFKHLSGEYPTATAFAVWLGNNIISTQHVPASIASTKRTSIKNIVICNSWFDSYRSLILLQAC